MARSLVWLALALFSTSVMAEPKFFSQSQWDVVVEARPDPSKPLAENHCSKFGRLAVYRGNMGQGPQSFKQVYSCVEPAEQDFERAFPDLKFTTRTRESIVLDRCAAGYTDSRAVLAAKKQCSFTGRMQVQGDLNENSCDQGFQCVPRMISHSAAGVVIENCDGVIASEDAAAFCTGHDKSAIFNGYVGQCVASYSCAADQ